MKRYFACCAVVVFCFCAGCNPDKVEPSPDLSGTITFKWETNEPTTTSYYVVISDTTGKVLEWKKLDNAIKTSFSYPADPKIAVVTLVESIVDGSSSRQTNMTTFTGITGDDYYNDISQVVDVPVVPSGQLNITIPSRSNYNMATVYVKGRANLTSYTDDEALEYNYDLTTDNDLFVLLEKIEPRFYRYLYTPHIPAGEVTITPEDFETLTEVDAHALVYPDHATKMDYSLGVINGVTGTVSRSTYALDVTQWESDEQPILRYPNIANLFPGYETIVVGIGKHGESYITDVFASTVTTNIVNLNTSIVSNGEVSTKKISVDFTGDAKIIFISDNFGPGEDNVQWDVYTPMTSKLRLNLPHFPDDLLKALPALAEAGDQPFNQLSTDDYNMSYEEFYQTKLKGDFNIRLDEIRSTNYPIDQSGGGRRAVDVNKVLKRHHINLPTIN